jgi:hypothetical protein
MPDVAALTALATAQGGVFTVADAKACGWTHHGVGRAVAHGEWKRLYPGVLVDTGWLESLTPEAQHLVRLRGRLLFRGEGWHAARRTAALVHGLPLIGRPPAVPQLVRDKTSLGLRGHTRHERISTLPVEERSETDVPSASLARTVADISREECFRNAVVVADGALRAGATREELLHVAQRCSEWPGGRGAKPVALFADGMAETALESISRVAFRHLGLPAPELQVEIWCYDTFLARVDFLWREFNVVGEADGRKKYESVDDLYKEKRREERLRDVGFEIPRWDWEAAYRPGPELKGALTRAFARGALNTLAPGVRLVPTALRALAA